MDTPELETRIAHVNAWADLIATFTIGTFQVRTREHRALGSAAVKTLEDMLDWPEVERRDGQHIVYQAPDGSHVLYSYEQEGEQFVERLTKL